MHIIIRGALKQAVKENILIRNVEMQQAFRKSKTLK